MAFIAALRPVQSAKSPMAVAHESEATQLADPFTSGSPTPPAAYPWPSIATICDKLGGLAAVKAAVDIFCSKVLGDDRVINFSNELDMKAQRAKQARARHTWAHEDRIPVMLVPQIMI